MTTASSAKSKIENCKNINVKVLRSSRSSYREARKEVTRSKKTENNFGDIGQPYLTPTLQKILVGGVSMPYTEAMDPTYIFYKA